MPGFVDVCSGRARRGPAPALAREPADRCPTPGSDHDEPPNPLLPPPRDDPRSASSLRPCRHSARAGRLRLRRRCAGPRSAGAGLHAATAALRRRRRLGHHRAGQRGPLLGPGAALSRRASPAHAAGEQRRQRDPRAALQRCRQPGHDARAARARGRGPGRHRLDERAGRAGLGAGQPRPGPGHGHLPRDGRAAGLGGQRGLAGRALPLPVAQHRLLARRQHARPGRAQRTPGAGAARQGRRLGAGDGGRAGHRPDRRELAGVQGHHLGGRARDRPPAARHRGRHRRPGRAHPGRGGRDGGRRHRQDRAAGAHAVHRGGEGARAQAARRGHHRGRRLEHADGRRRRRAAPGRPRRRDLPPPHA